MFSSNGTQVAADNAFIEDLFSTFVYTGNGSTATITNGIDLSTKGGLVWTKSRGMNGNHWLLDTVRGINNGIYSNSTAAQFSDPGTFTSFNTTGYTMNNSYGDLNSAQAGRTYVSWTFRKQPKFFDIVTYTGTGAGNTINHNLGSKPGCIIIKRTNAAGDWFVVSRKADNDYALFSNTGHGLNNTAAANGSTAGGDFSATTINIAALNSSNNINVNGGTYIAYIFAHNAGGFGLTGNDNAISCGSFTGSGSSGTTVNLGWEPQWVMIKKAADPAANGPSGWVIMDNMRGLGKKYDNALLTDTSTSEAGDVSVSNAFELQSTGFKLLNANGALNVSTDTYIYIAIRRGPMRVPTLGTSVFKPQTRSGTASAATVTGVGFAPDLTIFITRNRTTLAWNFPFCDRLRGPQQQIHSNTTAAEAKNDYGLFAYTMDGMSLGSDGTDSGINYSTSTYVDYFFKRAPGFFDEVCYTGTGTSNSQSHNLTVAPELVLIKRRDATSNWVTLYGFSISTYSYFLPGVNGSGSSITSGGYGSGEFVGSQPTTTQLPITSAASQTNSSDPGTYVAYLFATLAGVSKVGSYTGNGSSQTINCGFTGGARFVLIKRTDDTGGWYAYDTARGMTSYTDPYSLLNAYTYATGNAEADTLGSVTTVSTGFALNSAVLAAINISAGTYIFLAIA